MAPTPVSRSSTSPPDRVAIGEVVGAHGLRGQLRVRGPAGAAEALAAAERVWLLPPGAAPAEERALLRLRPGRPGELRVAVEGLRQRSEAEARVGWTLAADAAALAPLAEGEFYAFQLLGCALRDADGAAVGRVTGIWETGAPDLLVVAGEGGREHLIPASLLREVEPEARRAVVELPEGLLDPAGG